MGCVSSLEPKKSQQTPSQISAAPSLKPIKESDASSFCQAAGFSLKDSERMTWDILDSTIEPVDVWIPEGEVVILNQHFPFRLLVPCKLRLNDGNEKYGTRLAGTAEELERSLFGVSFEETPADSSTRAMITRWRGAYGRRQEDVHSRDPNCIRRSTWDAWKIHLVFSGPK